MHTPHWPSLCHMSALTSRDLGKAFSECPADFPSLPAVVSEGESGYWVVTRVSAIEREPEEVLRNEPEYPK